VFLTEVTDFFLTTFAVETPDTGEAARRRKPMRLASRTTSLGTDSIGCFSNSSCMSLISFELVEEPWSIEVIFAICLIE